MSIPHLRPATTDDEATLRSIYASTRAEELALTDWTDAQKEAFCDMQFDAQDRFYRQHYPDAEFLMIESGSQPAGRLYVYHGNKEIRIIDIALLPNYRRHGYGTQLLRDLQAQATASEKYLGIHVEKFNPALLLYQRLGFQFVEDKGVYLYLQWRQSAVVAEETAVQEIS